MKYKRKGKEYEHRIVWVLRYGDIPDGYHIHHKNGNKLDNRIENLELVDASTHIHIESGHIKTKDGWSKRCNKCNEYKLLDNYYYDKKRKRYLSLCKKCFIDYMIMCKKRGEYE